MSPISNKNSKDIGLSTRRPLGSNCDAVKNAYEELVPFNSSRYPDGENGLMYMRPPSSPPRNCTRDCKHQKKKGSCSRSTKPSKLNLISPLPNFRLNSIHHLLKYYRKQYRADKSSTGSNHTSIHKHYPVCHLNPTIATRESDAMIKKKRGGVVDSASVLPAKSTSKSKLQRKCSVFPTLSIQQAYSVQVKKSKRKELFALLDKIPEAKEIRAWNLSKFDPDGVQSKPPSRHVHSSMFSNPFKFKKGRRRETKKDPQRIKRKEKGPKQTLGLYEQQLCQYHSPTISPLVLPSNKTVMVITVDPITVLPSKITSVSPSLVAVTIDEPEPVPDEGAELEKLVASSDVDLDKIIKFGSLYSVMVLDTFLSSGISTADVVAGDLVYHIDLGNLHDDETVVVGNKSKIYYINKVDTTLFYNDSPRA